MRRVVLFCGASLLALLASRAAGAELVETLVAPPAEVAPGTQVGIGLLAVNPGATPVEFAPPAILAGTLWRAERAWPLELRSQPGSPTEDGLYADAEAVLGGLAVRGVDARHQGFRPPAGQGASGFVLHRSC